MDAIISKKGKTTKEKLFKYTLIFVIVLFVFVLGSSIIQYADYLQGQSCAVALMEAANDEYDSFNGSHNELVKKIYNDLCFSNAYYVNEALGEALEEMGYSRYSGLHYLECTGFFGFFSFTVDLCIDGGILCIGSDFGGLVYNLYAKKKAIKNRVNSPRRLARAVAVC